MKNPALMSFARTLGRRVATTNKSSSTARRSPGGPERDVPLDALAPSSAYCGGTRQDGDREDTSPVRSLLLDRVVESPDEPSLKSTRDSDPAPNLARHARVRSKLPRHARCLRTLESPRR